MEIHMDNMQFIDMRVHINECMRKYKNIPRATSNSNFHIYFYGDHFMYCVIYFLVVLFLT